MDFPISIDIETTGLEYSAKVLSVGIGWFESGEVRTTSWSLTANDLFHTGIGIPALRANIIHFVNRATRIYGHNLAFDLSYVFKLGILLPEEVKMKLFDTLLTARMTDSYDRVNLVAVANSFNIYDDKWLAIKKQRRKLSQLDVGSVLAYQEMDCKYQLLTGEALYKKALKIYDHDFLMRESDFCRVVAKMRCNGQPLDVQKTEKRIYDNEQRISEINHKILWPNRIGNVNSSKEIGLYLRKNGMQPVTFTKKGEENRQKNKSLESWEQLKVNEKLDEDSLDFLTHLAPNQEVINVIKAIIELRGLTKENDTWLKPFLGFAEEDGLIHPNFTVAGAVSYRLTCSNPGLQAIPHMDVWEPMLVADIKQAEYRLAALYAKFNSLAQGYSEGLDAHTITATLLLGRPPLAGTDERKHFGKSVNFAILYGAGEEKLAAATGFSVEEVRKLRNKMKQELKPIFAIFYHAKELWEQRGYIKLWTGKRIFARTWDAGRSYKAFNQVCQGGVAELCKEAMMRLDEEGFILNNQVHDALYLPPASDWERVEGCMIDALPGWMSNLTTPPIKLEVDLELKPKPEKKVVELEKELDELEEEVHDATQTEMEVFWDERGKNE